MPHVVRDPVTVPVDEPTQVGEARRTALALADSIGFDETRRAEVGIVVTEAANNVLKHGRGGEVVLRSLRAGSVDGRPAGAPDGGGGGIEVLAIDRGPGIGNVALAFRDGFSTGATPGTGLGAIRRLASAFDLFAAPGGGTVLMAHVLATPAARAGADGSGGAQAGGTAAAAAAAPTSSTTLGAVCLPKAGEEACGDAWAVDEEPGRVRILVADGLGHGLQAADASREAVRVFRERPELPPGRLLEAMHAALRGTRGAAAAVAELRPGRGELAFAGVGNVAATVLPDAGGDPSRPAAHATRSLVSHNGTLGAEARRFQEFVYPWPPGGLLVVCSDGIGTQWQLAKYPGVRARHPAVTAGLLYRDFRRQRDDVTVLVARDAAARV